MIIMTICNCTNTLLFALSFQDYPSNMTFYVKKISSIILGKEIIKWCGSEGKHKDLNEDDQTTLRFLQTAISFVSDAVNMGADLTNAAFIISQPGRQFVIQAGNGDWEFFFSEDANNVVHGRCVHKGPKQVRRHIWNSCVSFVSNLGSANEEDIPITALAGRTGLLALPCAT